MKDIFLSELETAKGLAEPSHRVEYLICLCRSILQHASVSLCEYACTDTTIEGHPYAIEVMGQLLEPADGTTQRIIDTLLPIVSQDWLGCGRDWFRPKIQPTIQGLTECNLAYAVESFIRFRNDRPGHGVMDRCTIEATLTWLPDFAQCLIDGLKLLLPSLVSENSDELQLVTPTGILPITLLRLHEGRPILYRKISRKASVWRVNYQVLDSESAPDAHFDLDSNAKFFQTIQNRPRHFFSRTLRVSADKKPWVPLIHVPRPTTTVFEGRKQELVELLDWYNDVDSRACLVYGEGGIGKTTLVLEFLSSIFEGDILDKTCWHPEIVCFFSAKQTRWSANGIEYLRGVIPAVEDGLRLLARAIDRDLGRDWFTIEAPSLVDKVSGLISEAGLKKSDNLFILDNMETLAQSAGEEAALAKLLSKIANKVARVIVTSRRREKIEARPLELQPLSEAESTQLIRQLAETYGATSLVKAGDARIKKEARALGGKPLLIDVFVRYAGHPQRSIDQAAQLVLKAAGRDLGDFLFADAWQRMGAQQRKVFFVITRPCLPNPIDGQMVSWACSDIGLSRTEWEDAFEETRFGKVVSYVAYDDVQLDGNACEFVRSRFDCLDKPERDRIESHAMALAKRGMDLLKARDSSVTDRIAQAFRTTAAKVAKMKAASGDYESAVLWYEEAVTTDPNNAALWDRYAWYLMVNGRDPARARDCAQEACRLAPEDADVHFTAGMIAAREGRIFDADKALEQAQKLGKARHLCLVQQAIARMSLGEKASTPELTEAKGFIESATKLKRPLGFLDQKHISECHRLSRRLNDLFADRRLKR